MEQEKTTEKKRKRKDIGKKVAEVTGDIFGSVFDFLLFELFCLYTGSGARTFSEVNYSLSEAETLLDTVNHTTVKNALYALVKKGFTSRNKTPTGLSLIITNAGKRRLNELLPAYKTNRPWDGYLYLISYDIPTKSNAARNLLRSYLLKLGCALLQESLWMTPYNPKSIVEEYIGEHRIPGTVLVSKLGRDGSIGDQSREELISKIYRYAQLQEKYRTFIDTYGNNTSYGKTEVALAYFPILRNDPQLPFPLEPKGFFGTKAYHLFSSRISS